LLLVSRVFVEDLNALVEVYITRFANVMELAIFPRTTANNTRIRLVALATVRLRRSVQNKQLAPFALG
jgi:hypothetical protein